MGLRIPNELYRSLNLKGFPSVLSTLTVGVGFSRSFIEVPAEEARAKETSAKEPCAKQASFQFSKSDLFSKRQISQN
jgi:hypothetical protein